MSRRLLVPVLVTAVAVSLGGCGKVGATGDKGYIDGAGVITVLDDAERAAPGPVSGTTLDGKKVSLSDYAGKVVVINVWGSWCPPCRAEAGTLAQAARALMPRGVVFLGIDSRDTSADNARAFERTRDMPYSSIYDPSGVNLLAFHGTLSPNSIPSTVVVDKQGRVAASILGRVPTVQTLVDLIDEVNTK